LPESRIFALDSESRINTVVPESREEEIDQETRVLDNNF